MSAQALSLYRKLWRKTRVLPRQYQVYYRGQIRSGFVSFRDEDDPEMLQRIEVQCQREAEWILNKYKDEPKQQGSRRK